MAADDSNDMPTTYGINQPTCSVADGSSSNLNIVKGSQPQSSMAKTSEAMITSQSSSSITAMDHLPQHHQQQQSTESITPSSSTASLSSSSQQQSSQQQHTTNLEELCSLLRNEVPESRQTLLDTQSNLEKVADYCSTAYLEVKFDCFLFTCYDIRTSITEF